MRPNNLFNFDSMSDEVLNNLISKAKFEQYIRTHNQILKLVASGKITQDNIVFVRHWPGNMDDLTHKMMGRLNVSYQFAGVFVSMVYQDEVR